MSANLRRYLVAMFGFEHVVRLVPSASWSDPSPCEEWTAGDVAGHAMAVVNNIAARAGVGDQLDPFGDDLSSYLGTDPLETWRATRSRLLVAVDRRGALQRDVSSSLGTMTLDRFLGLMVADITIHTWDLARAVGVDERLDPELVEYVHADLISRDSPALRGPARYAAALDAGSDPDPQTALLRLTGRDC